MTSATEVVKSAGPKLVPFFKTVAIYFVIFVPHDQPCILGAVVKILPIISLMIFVGLYSRNLADEYKWFSRRILTGLIFSSIGDVCLVWSKEYFDYGMVAFAIGHVNYIIAFGFKPFAFRVGLLGYLLTVICTMCMMPGLHGKLALGVPIYSAILSTMIWRAVARLYDKEERTWSKLFTTLGAISFAISDIILGVNIFVYAINYSQALTMLTYYGAQLGIALSVVDPRNTAVKKAH